MEIGVLRTVKQCKEFNWKYYNYEKITHVLKHLLLKREVRGSITETIKSSTHCQRHATIANLS